MKSEMIKIPDVGGAENVEVIEVCVAAGDRVEVEDSLVVLETDKASMEVPSPVAGKVVAVRLNVGDSVSEGDVILELELESSAGEEAPEVAAEEPPASPEEPSAPSEQPSAPSEQPSAPPEQPAAENLQETAAESAPTDTITEELITVPDIGGSDGVEVIEVCVSEGQEIAEGDSLIVLESDKASMEVPSPRAGVVSAIQLQVGDQAGEGTPILTLSVRGTAPHPAPVAKAAEPPVPESRPAAAAPVAPAAEPKPAVPEPAANGADVYAGPAVRKLAREFSIELGEVKGSGPRGRILKEDLQAYVKSLVENRAAAPAASGTGIPAVPAVDFAKFGEVTQEKLSKLDRLTASNMHRSWLNVPHVTQFDDADITDLETFRKELKAESEKRGVKLTPLPFLLKACAAALRANPKFNASLHSDGEHIVYKHYVHIGVAVDTPVGLMVPVIRDVDRKSLWELAAESAELAQKAKERKLTANEMQGGCFTISSLGNIGGTGFTPIVNTPEVAILGVSKLAVKPVWDGQAFVPRQMLPLSLSYDHRAINGADAGKFFTHLGQVLADIRRLLL